ncbi:uncharacterized protein [Leptinotarsa decemlineata]|uniref:uncharacterized protein n=1 Tax=Leptinotarsa decemlineata TaxID=7539 RepID=UPI003D30A203
MREHMKIVNRAIAENVQLKEKVDSSTVKLFNGFDQAIRIKNLEIHGIPERDNENSVQILNKIGDHVKFLIDENMIDCIHRVPTNKKCSPRDKPKNIIVTFSSRKYRGALLTSVKANKMDAGSNNIALEVVVSYNAAQHTRLHDRPVFKSLVDLKFILSVRTFSFIKIWLSELVSEAGPSKRCISKPVWKRPWLTEAELHAALEESDEEPFVASDTDDYIPEPADLECEESDVGNEPVIKQEEEYDSDESIKEEPALTQPVVFVSKNGTQWRDTPHPQAQTLSRNILRQKGGAAAFSALLTAKEIFNIIMSNEMCNIIVRESDRKGRKETENYNAELIQRYKASERP